VWCGDHPLKETFLELFSIASSRNAYVVDHLLFSSGSLQWTVNFAKAAYD
jgi:hypothetical protein